MTSKAVEANDSDQCEECGLGLGKSGMYYKTEYHVMCAVCADDNGLLEDFV
jgi:hypothetical protein